MEKGRAKDVHTEAITPLTNSKFVKSSSRLSERIQKEKKVCMEFFLVNESVYEMVAKVHKYL